MSNNRRKNGVIFTKSTEFLELFGLELVFKIHVVEYVGNRSKWFVCLFVFKF